MNNKYKSGIASSMFDTPTTYTESLNYYTNLLQQKINDVSQYASDNYQIGEEVIPGTMEFAPIVCRVNTAISPKTGKNLGDDFKELKFLDLAYHATMGKRYQFSNSIWITSNTDDYKYVTKSAVVRRCNNELRWISNGKIISEPCYINYSMKYSNVYYNDSIDIPQGTISITCQYNDNSKQIQINDRFIFGSQVFKIKSVIDSLRKETFNKDSVYLIEFEAYVDSIAPDDDFNIQVANMNKYNNIIPTTPYNIILSPDDYSILQGSTQQYNCYLYLNGIKTDDEFVFSFSNVDLTYYSSNILSGNSFSIVNNKHSKNKLIVTCTSGQYSSDFEISLKGLY